MGFFQKLWTDNESDRQETVHLQTEVPPGTTGWTDAVAYTVDDPATVEEVIVWHVPNSESALRTRPRRVTQNRRYDLPTYSDEGEDFITGEPDEARYLSNTAVDQGDEIVVEARNENDTYAYRFNVRVVLDYAGGTSRFLGGGS